ncbi:hypothetical protein KHA80_12945 [Anaerobacillus sp. HL2]|nr:hypothetical protein KHA80_12945 [Anaerobacillus sp. HL2]
MMGKVSQCTPLISWSGPPVQYPQKKNELSNGKDSSQGQQQASEQIVNAVGHRKNSLSGQLLVQAKPKSFLKE